MRVKEAIAHSMTLNFFDPRRRTEILTDASRLHGIGFALVQRDKSDKPFLIQCGSRSLTAAEKNYAIIELEMLAIVWAVRKCRHFLLGAPHFTVVCDHKPLLGIHRKHLQEIDNNRLLKMRLKLSDYTYDIKWQAGKVHFLADLLSRSPAFGPSENDDIFINEVVVDICRDPKLHNFRQKALNDEAYMQLSAAILRGDSPRTLSHSHPASAFESMWDDLSVQDGLVVYKNRLVVPKVLQGEILHLLHTSHQGIVKTLREARSLYFWHGMKNSIMQCINECKQCQKYRPSQQQQPSTQTFSSASFERVSVDLFTLEGAKTHFLVMVDQFSGYIFIDQMRTTTSEAVIKKIGILV